MKSARLPRILGAIFYDSLIVFALIFVAAQWFPLVPDAVQIMPVMVIFKQLYVLGIAFFYFGYSWRRGGQTIGMKSWRLKIENSDAPGVAISWRQALLRYAVSIFSWLIIGLGFLWTLINASHRSWHDLASHTYLIVLPKT